MAYIYKRLFAYLQLFGQQKIVANTSNNYETPRSRESMVFVRNTYGTAHSSLVTTQRLLFPNVNGHEFKLSLYRTHESLTQDPRVIVGIREYGINSPTYF
jgi:TfoX/Sxy family transcriptional regulator of competence genes